MTTYQTIAATGMSRKALYAVLKELVDEQKTIFRAGRGTYAAVPAPAQALGRTGAPAGIQSARLLESADAGRGHIGTFLGDVQSTHGRSTWAGKGDGVRGPGVEETPLSEAESIVAMREAAYV